jgi:hypothetical protein
MMSSDASLRTERRNELNVIRALSHHGPPCPDIDPEYEGLTPEEWDKVPVFPDRFASEWSDALLVNRLDDARPLVEAALSSRGVGLGADATVWPRLLRLALVVAARAHSINARREQGDYRDGFPQSADLPLAQVPGDFAPAEPVADQARPGAMPPAARASEPHVRTPRLRHRRQISASARRQRCRFKQRLRARSTQQLDALIVERVLSQSFAEYLADPQVIGPNGDPKAIKQAKLALDKFTQLIGDLPIGDITDKP